MYTPRVTFQLSVYMPNANDAVRCNQYPVSIEMSCMPRDAQKSRVKKISPLTIYHLPSTLYPLLFSLYLLI
jgi:hypothetical protein